jgi:hypothetical protein
LRRPDSQASPALVAQNPPGARSLDRQDRRRQTASSAGSSYQPFGSKTGLQHKKFIIFVLSCSCSFCAARLLLPADSSSSSGGNDALVVLDDISSHRRL